MIGWQDGRPKEERSKNPLPPRPITILVQIAQHYSPEARATVFVVSGNEEGVDEQHHYQFALTDADVQNQDEQTLVKFVKRETNRRMDEVCRKIAQHRPYRVVRKH